MKIKVFQKFFVTKIQNPGGSSLTKVLTRPRLSQSNVQTWNQLWSTNQSCRKSKFVQEHLVAPHFGRGKTLAYDMKLSYKMGGVLFSLGRYLVFTGEGWSFLGIHVIFKWCVVFTGELCGLYLGKACLLMRGGIYWTHVCSLLWKGVVFIVYIEGWFWRFTDWQWKVYRTRPQAKCDKLPLSISKSPESPFLYMVKRNFTMR